LQRRDVQYVVVSSRLPDLLASQASRAGLDVNEYRKISGAKQMQLLGKWFQTMAARVFNFGDADGPAGPTPSLDYLRLVYVSPVVVKVAEQLGGQTSAGRVWEYVVGADVHGSAPPDTDVTVQVKFHFLAQSKVLVANSWNTTVRSGPDGKFNLRVPYCSGANGEAQVSEMSYTTTLGKTNFTLTESQVLNGDTVVLK
ncbi:MAG: hypothetical protein QGF46_06825, partial [Planctomycetota bacterium]|nr:hypothetical protein [Planctomycetota bacterium]